MEERIITWGLVKVPSAPYNGPCKEFGFYSEEVRSHWRGLSRDVTRSGFHFDRAPVGIDCPYNLFSRAERGSASGGLCADPGKSWCWLSPGSNRSRRQMQGMFSRKTQQN